MNFLIPNLYGWLTYNHLASYHPYLLKWSCNLLYWWETDLGKVVITLQRSHRRKANLDLHKLLHSFIDSDKTACPCIVNLTVNRGWLQISFCFPKIKVRKEKAELSLKLQKGHGPPFCKAAWREATMNSMQHSLQKSRILKSKSSLKGTTIWNPRALTDKAKQHDSI